MKKYVFESYSDKKGSGTLRLFDSKKEAVEYAKDEWNRLVKSDKEKIDRYHVYEVEMTDEQLADYQNGENDFIFDDLWTADVWDAIGCNGKGERKMMNLEQMKKNGTVEQDGKEYVLTQEAYRDGEEFTAMAICLQDTADEDGWQTAYRVNWEIIGEDEDESNNADWDNPYNIKEIGEYNVNDGRFY